MPKRARDLPVFSDGYDWAEDQRVFKVLKQLDEQDKECLFYCITEHLGDKHYCFTYGFNGEDHIETVGSMCHHAAAGQLASAFAGGPGARVPDLAFHSRTIGPDDDWEAWCGGHKNVPLYKQQIEMCEALIKRIVASNYIAKYVPEAEKAEYIAFIRGQIEKLDREKTPIFSPYGKMSWAVGGIYIDNPEMAKRIGAR
ncbi:MAG TPA: hypothetical protein VKB78_16555 [Pirellulales bacterium]|nr:hypothetical protein [Pirellulales bacterium]